ASPHRVPEAEQALAVVARQNTIAGTQVGDVGEPRAVEPHAFLRAYLGVRRFQLAQGLGERELLRGGERGVAAGRTYGVTVHAALDGRRIPGRQRLADVDTRALGDEHGM